MRSSTITREQAEHFLIDAAALRIVVTHGRLRDPHRPRHIDLFLLVGPEQFPGEPRADRGQQLGYHQFLGLKHPRGLARIGPK